MTTLSEKLTLSLVECGAGKVIADALAGFVGAHGRRGVPARGI